jgi:hypothetical protein
MYTWSALFNLASCLSCNLAAFLGGFMCIHSYVCHKTNRNLHIFVSCVYLLKPFILFLFDLPDTDIVVTANCSEIVNCMRRKFVISFGFVASALVCNQQSLASCLCKGRNFLILRNKVQSQFLLCLRLYHVILPKRVYTQCHAVENLCWPTLINNIVWEA